MRVLQTLPMPSSRANDSKRISNPDNWTDDMKQNFTSEEQHILRKYHKDCTDEERKRRIRLIDKFSQIRHYKGESRKQIHKPRVHREKQAAAPVPSALNQAPSAFSPVARQEAPLNIKELHQLTALRAPVTLVYS